MTSGLHLKAHVEQSREQSKSPRCFFMHGLLATRFRSFACEAFLPDACLKTP